MQLPIGMWKSNFKQLLVNSHLYHQTETMWHNNNNITIEYSYNNTILLTLLYSCVQEDIIIIYYCSKIHSWRRIICMHLFLYELLRPKKNSLCRVYYFFFYWTAFVPLTFAGAKKKPGTHVQFGLECNLLSVQHTYLAVYAYNIIYCIVKPLITITCEGNNMSNYKTITCVYRYWKLRM